MFNKTADTPKWTIYIYKNLHLSILSNKHPGAFTVNFVSTLQLAIYNYTTFIILKFLIEVMYPIKSIYIAYMCNSLFPYRAIHSQPANNINTAKHLS